MCLKSVLSKITTSLTLIFFLLSHQSLLGQEFKIEKEERVALAEVPTQSIEWLDVVFPNNPKVKWYRESTSGKISFEAKFKYLGKKYSVEFSEEGVFEDIEFLVKWKSLNTELKNQLLGLLSNYEKIKIKRFQKQWTSSSQEALQLAIKNADASKITERYELVFQGKTEDIYHMWEALLSQDQLIRVTEVLLRSTANLEF